MVTPKELREAGGSMAQAQVNKALDLVRRTREAQQGLDEHLRGLVLDALEILIAQRPNADAKELRQFVAGFIERVKAAGGELTLGQALKLQADARADLLPYTDKKQPVAVEVDGGAGPSVVIMAADPVSFHQVAMGGEAEADFIEVFPSEPRQVTDAKSRDDQQTLALPGLDALPPAD